MIAPSRLRATMSAGLVALSTVTVVISGAGTATAAQIDASTFKLKETGYNSVIAQLDGVLTRASVADVLASANHKAPRATVSATNFVTGFKWETTSGYDDNGTTKWYPQGVTTAADALDAGRYQGKDVVLASWYDADEDGVDKGVRISFVDWTDKANPKYRNVLLVEPYASGGQPTFRAVNVHAGGMFWYGNVLYVVDTWGGLRVFDLDHLYKVSTGKQSIGRQSDGAYHAYDYAYVLPQSRRYTPVSPTGDNAMRFSFVSLDRTTSPDSIVAGEYDVDGTGTRLVRWDIDYTNRQLKTTSGVATARWAWQVNIGRMQGATSINGKFFIARSNSATTRGDLITWVPGNPIRIHTGALPAGPEDLSYRADTNELWTLSEHPNNRFVFAVRPSSFS